MTETAASELVAAVVVVEQHFVVVSAAVAVAELQTAVGFLTIAVAVEEKCC